MSLPCQHAYYPCSFVVVASCSPRRPHQACQGIRQDAISQKKVPQVKGWQTWQFLLVDILPGQRLCHDGDFGGRGQRALSCQEAQGPLRVPAARYAHKYDNFSIQNEYWKRFHVIGSDIMIWITNQIITKIKKNFLTYKLVWNSLRGIKTSMDNFMDKKISTVSVFVQVR